MRAHGWDGELTYGGPPVRAGPHKEASVDKVKDPVCGMMITAETAAGNSEYNGSTYYFCSPGCKASFDGNPQRYAANKQG